MVCKNPGKTILPANVLDVSGHTSLESKECRSLKVWRFLGATGRPIQGLAKHMSGFVSDRGS